MSLARPDPSPAAVSRDIPRLLGPASAIIFFWGVHDNKVLLRRVPRAEYTSAIDGGAAASTRMPFCRSAIRWVGSASSAVLRSPMSSTKIGGANLTAIASASAGHLPMTMENQARAMSSTPRREGDPRRQSRSRDGEHGGLNGEIAVPDYRGVPHIDDRRTPSPRTGRLEPEQRPGWQGPAWKPDDPALISLPEPAWLSAR